MDGKSIQIEEEEQRTQDPEFWNDPKSAEQQLRNIARLKSWVQGFNGVLTAVDDLNVLAEFLEAGESSEEEVTSQYNEALTLTEAQASSALASKSSQSQRLA